MDEREALDNVRVLLRRTIPSADGFDVPFASRLANHLNARRGMKTVDGAGTAATHFLWMAADAVQTDDPRVVIQRLLRIAAFSIRWAIRLGAAP